MERSRRAGIVIEFFSPRAGVPGRIWPETDPNQGQLIDLTDMRQDEEKIKRMLRTLKKRPVPLEFFEPPEVS